VAVSKVMVPPAADTHPDKDAVSVTLAPAVGLAGEAVTVAGVSVVVAWALVMAESKNIRRIARLPQPFWMLVNVASAILRVVAMGLDPVLFRISLSALADLFWPFRKRF
jgi:hypothetical protein